MRKLLMRIVFVVLLSYFSFSISACRDITGGQSSDTFYMLSNWEPVALKNHISGGALVGNLIFFSVEPLIQYVRSTDEIFFMLAESVDHRTDGTTIIYLRPEAKWHNGDDFLAEDVIAYHYINQMEATNYMLAIEELGPKTIKITWKSHIEPNNSVKNLILAADPVGSVKYSEFKPYVDRIKEIMEEAPMMPDGYTGRAPFGRLRTDKQQTDSYDNYAAFSAHNPDWFIGTGAFKPFQITATDMILKRNPDHWAADYITFEYIHAYNNITDPTQVFGMLANGRLDYAGGTPAQSTLNQILNSNPSLVHYKGNDPGASGLLFNLSKTINVNGVQKPLFNDKIREGFQYIFERESIAHMANPYSMVTYRSMMAMAPSDAQTYMSERVWNALPVYSHDHAKAGQLLREGGWNKLGNAWHGEDDQKLAMTIHFDGSNDHQARAAQATAAQMNAFGIETKLKSSSSWADWFGTAQSRVWSSELSLNWTDLNMSFSYPTGSFVYAFKDVTHKVVHLPKYPSLGEPGYQEVPEVDRGQISATLENLDGETFRLIDLIEGFYSLSDAGLEKRVDDLIYGVSMHHWAVPFYQNTVGMFYNSQTVKNLPRQDLWIQGRNITYVPMNNPEQHQDFLDFGRLNLAFSYAVTFIDWVRFHEDRSQ